MDHQYRLSPTHKLESDGSTVWVNGPDGCCIGRFSRFGIDIHRTLAQQQTTGKECLLCTHGKTTLEDWQHFVDGMQKHHSITVNDIHKPRFLMKDTPHA